MFGTAPIIRGREIERATAGGTLDFIWQTRDRRGREIAFTAAGQDHILNKDADMAELIEEIRLAIEQPDQVARDARYPRRENHYGRIPATGRWIKVVVKHHPVEPQGTWAGEVVTAYPVPRPKPKEARLWP